MRHLRKIQGASVDLDRLVHISSWVEVLAILMASWHKRVQYATLRTALIRLKVGCETA
jgi:hypothetical protein